MAKKSADARVELDHLLIVEGVFQTEHGDAVRHLAKTRRQRAADLVRRTVRPLQSRKSRLDRGITPFQGVKVGIGDAGRVQRVVVAVGRRNRGGKAVKLAPGLRRVQILDRHVL